ncbi:MAG: hypothetical protein JWM80_2296 [Cyanobacteria bacterium RYN_339]|nr:hypothetical protein [Cyanobacteria bacterium RYN_339]
MRRSLLWALVLAGCTSPCVTPDPAPAGATLTGLVSAPQRLVDPTGGPDQVPIPRAEVALANAAGQPIAGLYHAETGDGGGYAIGLLPPGYTYMVEATVPGADGKPITLKSLAKPSREANIDLATTLVTMAVTDGLTGLPGEVDPAAFDAASAAVRAHLTDADIPSPSDAAAAKAKVAQLAKDDPTLATQLEQLKKQAAAPTATVDQLKTDVAKTADQDPLNALAPVY